MNTTPEQEIQESLLEELEAERFERVRDHLRGLHPSEIADLLESQPSRNRELIWKLVDPAMAGRVLSHALDSVRAGLLEAMSPQEVAEATRGLDPDDLADILNDLPEGMADSVLLSMDIQNRERLASVILKASVVTHLFEKLV